MKRTTLTSRILLVFLEEKSVTVHLSKCLRAAAFLPITTILLAVGCSHPRSTPQAATAFSNEVTQALVGKQITIHGKFSLRCKLPACILLDNHQVVYLVHTNRGPFTPGEPYSEMEDKLVAVTGILRFYHAPPAEPGDQPVARLPDFFYFEAETAQLRLINQ